MIPSTFFRLSSIPEHRGKTSRNGCVGLPARVCHFLFLFACNQKPPNLGGLDDRSGGAGIRTLGCSKNRWEDFDGEGSRKYGAVERDAVLFGILRSEWAQFSHRANGLWLLKNSIFLEIAEIWGIKNVYPNRESRL
jgi:hypothetical protein